MDEELKKTTLRFPASIKKALKLIAVEEDITFNALVVNALEWFIQEYENGKVPKDVLTKRRRFSDD